MSTVRLAIALALAALPLRAETPRIVTDIAPVTAMISDILGDLGDPVQLLPPGVSPHDFSLRPSDARALQDADVVFWVGPHVTPQLQEIVATLAGDATVVTLSRTSGTPRLDAREDFAFTHSDEHGDHEDHGPVDPHVWLSPRSYMVWIEPIVQVLGKADPENADVYVNNAAVLLQRLLDTDRRIKDELSSATLGNYVVFHDAYQYLEKWYGLSPVGAVAASDAAPPGPRRLSDLRALLAEREVTCLITEPGVSPGLIRSVTEGLDIRTAVADPIGSDVEPGPDAYPRLLDHIVRTIIDCASPR